MQDGIGMVATRRHAEEVAAFENLRQPADLDRQGSRVVVRQQMRHRCKADVLGQRCCGADDDFRAGDIFPGQRGMLADHEVGETGLVTNLRQLEGPVEHLPSGTGRQVIWGMKKTSLHSHFLSFLF